METGKLPSSDICCSLITTTQRGSKISLAPIRKHRNWKTTKRKSNLIGYNNRWHDVIMFIKIFAMRKIIDGNFLGTHKR